MRSGQPDAFQAFDARGYLNEYYARVEGENDRLLAFHAQAHRLIPAGGTMLEFGGGPTLYQLISAAGRADEIVFSDYLPENLDEVRHWLAGTDRRFSWEPFVARALELEHASVQDPEAVCRREELLRERVSHVTHADIFADRPLGEMAGRYDTVAVNFVLESITACPQQWRTAVGRVGELVADDGHLVMTAITGASYWAIADRTFPAVNITGRDLEDAVRGAGFAVMHTDRLDADITDPGHPGYEGYTGMAMLVARRERS